MDEADGPLAGLRVVDLSNTPAGALASGMMADYGAEVVHVEPPGGSPLRSTPAFPMWNRGKRSVVLDLRTDDGRSTAAELATSADVLLETFRPGVADRLGLGFDRLHAVNPRLVHAAITGWGTDGPYAGVKGYEGLVAARLGILHSFERLTERPGPSFVSIPYCSFTASHTVLHGVLAALFERESSGLGQRVETSLVRAVSGINPWDWYLQVVSERYPGAYQMSPGFDDDGIPASSLKFKVLVGLTADGHWLQFAQLSPHLFRAFLRALGLERMVEDPYWEGLPEFEDVDRRRQFWEILLEAVRTRTLAEWQHVFDEDPDVWGEVFRRGTGLLEHPQMVHNRMVVDAPVSAHETVRQLAPVARIGGYSPRLRPPPELDADAGIERVWATDRPVDLPVGGAPPAHALSGITVVELGMYYAGPYGATMLGDLGARIIKIEAPSGDPIRAQGGFPETGGAQVLQGKESVAVDLSSPQGLAIVLDVVRGADIVLQSFRAGVAERLGVDAQSLRRVNPDLVYVEAPGYGASGPYGHRPAFAPTISAASGIPFRNLGAAPERADMDLEEVKRTAMQLAQAVGQGYANTDGMSAMGTATALLLGLLHRARGGGARTILTTMLSTVAQYLSETLVDYSTRPDFCGPDPDLLGIGPTYRLYRTGEGWVFLAVVTEREWVDLVAALLPDTDLGGDSRFATPEDRKTRADDLAAVLSELFLRRPATAWETRLLAAGVGCVRVRTERPEAVLQSAEFGRASGLVVDVHHPAFGDHPRQAPLVTLSRSGVCPEPGCLIGQHTDHVLGELGYSTDQLEALAGAGVIVR